MFSGQNDRPKGAKQAPTLKGGAERRQRQMMSVRHRAHGEMMKHVRGEEGVGDDAQFSGEVNMDVWAYDAKTPASGVPLALLPQFAQMVVSGSNDNEVFHGVLMIRKLLSVEKKPPHDEVIDTGVIPYLVQLLSRFDNPQLQFETAWAMTNIAAGTTRNAMTLIECGAIPGFIALLGSENADCRDQGAWAIGNIAGDSVPIRDLVLESNALPFLLQVMNNPEQPSNILRNSTWAASNLCRGKPSPPLERVAIALPTLCNLLMHPDPEVVADSLWAISYISEGPQERVQAVLDAGIVPHVVQLLGAPQSSLQIAAIRTVGNIAGGSNEQTQTIIDSGALSVFPRLFVHSRRDIRKEVCWTVSNISAGTSPQIDALIHAEVFPPLIHNCLRGTDLDVRKEAVWAVANVTMCGTDSQIRYLLNCNIISPLCEILTIQKARILTVALEALQGFLHIGESDRSAGVTEENMVARAVQECGGIDLLERLQTYPDHEVYVSALNLLESFFAVEENGLDVPQLNFDYNADFCGKSDQGNDGGFNF